MGIPQPLDNDKYQFVTRNKQTEPSSSKVVELKDRQKQESVAYLVSCMLAVEAISYWLKPKKFPLSRQQVLKLLGLQADVKELDDDSGELELVKFLQKHLEKQRSKKYTTLAKYEREINVLDDVKKSDPIVGSLQDELRLRLEKLYDDYRVEIDDVEQVTEYFDFMENYLDDWYATESKDFGFISLINQLKRNSFMLKNRLHTRLEDVIIYGQNSSLKGSLNFLEELSTIFQRLKQEYAGESARYLKKENGCQLTYDSSLSALKNKKEGDSKPGFERLLYGVHKALKPKNQLPYYQELIKNFKISKNNLLNLYSHKIEAFAYTQAVQIVERIDSTNQIYLEQMKSSEKFLIEIRDEFLTEIKIARNDILLPFMLENVSQHLHPEMLLKSVEEKVASPLLNWGSHRRVTEEMVRLSLLEELEPFAKKICDTTKKHLDQSTK